MDIDDSIVRTAEFLLREWAAIIKESNGDVWYRYDKQRVYHDALIAMKAFGLIGDYNVMTCKATLSGRVDSSKLVFVKSGKTVQVQ